MVRLNLAKVIKRIKRQTWRQHQKTRAKSLQLRKYRDLITNETKFQSTWSFPCYSTKCWGDPVLWVIWGTQMELSELSPSLSSSQSLSCNYYNRAVIRVMAVGVLRLHSEPADPLLCDKFDIAKRTWLLTLWVWTLFAWCWASWCFVPTVMSHWCLTDRCQCRQVQVFTAALCSLHSQVQVLGRVRQKPALPAKEGWNIRMHNFA